ncbi:hypothetical protein N7474_000889 [Penicillium riverlandense]|uniref:uncharacterized protein n=1 Tax=Penicillium riverlandense TaxID=1903569 RepID=UPI002547B722|nr:uncharacterized protein N7474_000889 [Penicillium riverlandense]KAJ5832578.1 hypothetical protein N7474_000889 [Penicillium riverlandense]
MAVASQPGTLPLYPGEVLDTIAGFPTIYHYQPADNPEASEASKPLVVCVPGALHSARIFYGGHQGHRPNDFLAYWLSKLGFGVLSLSYPVETSPPTMPLTGATFRLQDWGRQAAATTKKVIEQKSLTTRSVILLSWSMAGRMVVPFNIAAKELGLDVKQMISLAATPGMSSIRPVSPGMICTPAGYFSIPPRLENFYDQVNAMKPLNNNLETIPRDIYLREYLGGTPVNLIGLRLKYDGNGAFVQDEKTHEEDSQVFDMANTPFISAISHLDIEDASHALGDKAAWGFLLTYKLESMIGKQGLSKIKGTPKWSQVLDLVHSAPSRLMAYIDGNHFFFVGETSARKTADIVVKLLEEGTSIQNELSALLA